MDTMMLLKFFFAFAFVMALMMLFSMFLKKMGMSGGLMASGAKKRLKVVEFLPLDHRRKLVLVRRDNTEHLLVIGTGGETVVESNIPSAEDRVLELVKENKSA